MEPPSHRDVDFRRRPTQALLDRLTSTLFLHSLNPWYPSAVDRVHGGFLTRLDYRWRPTGSQEKFAITQARHVWTTSMAARRFPEVDVFREAADHGFRFLRDALWNREQGGFHVWLSADGRPLEADPARDMVTYGNAFAIYGLARYYGCTGDGDALELAQATLGWLDRELHDDVAGGYFRTLERLDKDMNTSIHMLEALTELHGVWSDAHVESRLNEMMRLVRDRVVGERGHMHLRFGADWTPLRTDEVSFCHDLETGFLLVEAVDALGGAHGLGLHEATRTEDVARGLVEHALLFGWDPDQGGLMDHGCYEAPAGSDQRTVQCSVTSDKKPWWGQAEALHTLLGLGSRWPRHRARYYGYANAVWDVISQRYLDWHHAGWYADPTDPGHRAAPKAAPWKGNYHDARALVRSLDVLSAAT